MTLMFTRVRANEQKSDRVSEAESLKIIFFLPGHKYKRLHLEPIEQYFIDHGRTLINIIPIRISNIFI